MADFLTIVAEPGLVCLAKSGISCAELGMRGTGGTRNRDWSAPLILCFIQGHTPTGEPNQIGQEQPEPIPRARGCHLCRIGQAVPGIAFWGW
jgi:hypothetical protein